MKLPVALLLGSLAVNAALLATLAARPALLPPGLRDVFAPGQRDSTSTAATPPAPKTPVPARTNPALLWSALASDDMPTLIARLRAAGFPASVIRSIVSARIEGSFSERLRALATTLENTPYWKPAPTNLMNNPKFYEERNQIFRDRARMLRELLGTEFFTSADSEVTAGQRRQYGNLPKAKIDLIERINDDYNEMMSQVRAATQGITLPEDREKLALLDREKRADLAKVLSPQELEDYNLRNSQITQRLRSGLTLMDASEAEFLTIFRLHQQYGDPMEQSVGYAGYITAEARQQRQERETLLANEIKSALGAERYAAYERSQNYEFQQLVRAAQRENLDPNAAVKAFDLRASSAAESMRIYDDKTLTPDQKIAAMRALAEKTRAQINANLGATIGASYAESASWLQAISAGNAVQFQGRSTSYRSLPTTERAAPRP